VEYPSFIFPWGCTNVYIPLPSILISVNLSSLLFPFVIVPYFPSRLLLSLPPFFSYLAGGNLFFGHSLLSVAPFLCYPLHLESLVIPRSDFYKLIAVKGMTTLYDRLPSIFFPPPQSKSLYTFAPYLGFSLYPLTPPPSST